MRYFCFGSLCCFGVSFCAVFIFYVLEDHKGSVIIGGRIFINFRYTDAIVLCVFCFLLLLSFVIQMTLFVDAEEEEGADDILTIQPVQRYKTEIGPDKTQQLATNLDSFQRDNKIEGKWLEEVKIFT